MTYITSRVPTLGDVRGHLTVYLGNPYGIDIQVCVHDTLDAYVIRVIALDDSYRRLGSSKMTVRAERMLVMGHDQALQWIRRRVEKSCKRWQRAREAILLVRST